MTIRTGDVHGLLTVAGRRVADLGTVHVVDVSPTPQAVTFSLRSDQLAAARAAGKRAHTTRGTIRFAVSNATDPGGIGGRGRTVSAGRHGTRRWRVRASASADVLVSTTAVGLARIAPHRYAGVRVDVRFDPDCAGPAGGTHVAP